MSPSPHDNLADLAERYWQSRLAASPLMASTVGDHRFDDRADDLSEAAAQAHRDAWAALRAEADALDPGALEQADVDTRALLIGELDDATAAVDHRLVELGANQMTGAHADLLILASMLNAPEPEHAEAAVTRVAALGRMLDQAADRYRAGLAAGRSPAAICVDRSLHQIDGYLGSDLADDPFAGMAGPPVWDGEPAWRERMRDAVRAELRPAFARYRAVLAEQLSPAARPDERPGLCHLPDGEELYAVLIRQETGLDLSADELHEFGLSEVTDVLPDEYRTIGQRLWDSTDLGTILDRLVNDPQIRYGSAEELLEHASGCLAAANAAVADWFGIRPQAPCVLTPVPDYLAADAPPAYYTHPSPDGSRPGEYHVNLHGATARSRSETASIAFHEAVPGHHLQLAIATERTELPMFRRLSMAHNSFVEGWALYSERLADEMGLYATELDRIGMLAADSWRSARLVVDTGLHARGWTRQQAIDFMTAHVPVDRDVIVTEVDRYIAMPAQALGYKVGQREILRLRADAQARLGAAFSPADFHDAVLGGATVSLPVLAARVGTWLAAAAPRA